MLGASSRLGPHAEKLKERDVWIVPHADDDPKKGRAAAERWRDEAFEGRANHVAFIKLTLNNDLNDHTQDGRSVSRPRRQDRAVFQTG